MRMIIVVTQHFNELEFIINGKGSYLIRPTNIKEKCNILSENYSQ